MPGAGKTHILSALAAQIIQSGALGDDQEVLNYTLIICKGVLMNLTKILTRFLFVFSSIIVFELGFYGNQWGAVDMDDLQYRRNVNEMLVYGRLVESRSDGIFSHGGLLGLGDASDFSVEKRVVDAQVRKYMKGKGFVSYWTYKSQPGFQGIVYSTRITRL